MHADYLIVGAGQAGRRAAESLRSLAPAARVCLVGEETELPYDRPILSKEALFNAEDEAKAFIPVSSSAAMSNAAMGSPRSSAARASSTASLVLMGRAYRHWSSTTLYLSPRQSRLRPPPQAST